jgi:HK97 family phage prohead protease
MIRHCTKFFHQKYLNMDNPIVDFVLSTEAVNRQGFRVLTSGIQLAAFRRNPIGLLNHRRDQLPVARWDNLRVEGAALLGQPIFDSHDPLAEALRLKYEQGIMTAVSIGIRPLAWSDAPEMLLEGQTLPTITECELLEVSLVDIPSNDAAVRLNFVTLFDAAVFQRTETPPNVSPPSLPTVQALLRAATDNAIPISDNPNEDDFTRFKKAAAKAKQPMYSTEFLRFKNA